MPLVSEIIESAASIPQSVDAKLAGYDLGSTTHVLTAPLQIGGNGTGGTEKTMFELTGAGEISQIVLKCDASTACTYKIYIDGVEIQTYTAAANVNYHLLAGREEYKNTTWFIEDMIRPLRFKTSFKLTVTSTQYSRAYGAYRMDA